MKVEMTHQLLGIKYTCVDSNNIKTYKYNRTFIIVVAFQPQLRTNMDNWKIIFFI